MSYKLFEYKGRSGFTTIVSGKAHRVGVIGKEVSFVEHDYFGEHSLQETILENHVSAARKILSFLQSREAVIDCAGHRFVHGGNLFKNSVILNKENLGLLESCLPIAPIHNPISMDVINVSREQLPGIPQYVTFDSAFHSTIPDYAYTYALPKKIIDKYSFRKYGFHGLSYSFVTKKAAEYVRKSVESLKIIACHLGTGGASVMAMKDGKSMDTSMGFSPLSGLIMSTRSGDIDPLLAVYLMVRHGYRGDDLMDLLNRKSGLLGISGFSSDIRDIISMFSGEDGEQAELAFKMYVHRLKKYIGSYAAALGGVDVLIFTDDIGVSNPLVRERVCSDMEWCGISIDKKSNASANNKETFDISSTHSIAKVLSIPTDEEYVIALEGGKLMGWTN